MKNLRIYGESPFQIAVIHGGPGAPGEMVPVARKLSSSGGILEPLQTAKTIKGQVDELKDVVTKKGDPPMLLIGWSWGAWLTYIFAAQNPASVKKLILVASGPFEEKYAQNIMKTRLNRLSEQDRAKTLLLIHALEDPVMEDKDNILNRLGKLISKADSYDPIPHKSYVLGCRYDIYQAIWKQAEELRSSGALLEYGKKIRCPVVAIHGDFDPHPAEGIRRPLGRVLEDFRFILVENCGHTPWIERRAKERFYDILRAELGSQTQ